jgi:hypothetical protein
MTEFPAVDLRQVADPTLDLRDDEGFEFRLVKQRFADTFLKLDLVGRTRGWYLDSLLLRIANAGPQGAADVAAGAGFRFVEGPDFSPAPRGRIEVWGRLAPVGAVPIPEPAQPVEG